MAETATTSTAIEVIPIHFNVEANFIPLQTFIQTAKQVEAILRNFDERIFQNQIQYQVLVLPPEPGTFLSKLGVIGAVGAAAWGFISSDPGAAFIEGLTGQAPAYWMKIAGEHVRAKIEESKILASGSGYFVQSYPFTDDRLQSQTAVVIGTQMAKSFFQMEAADLNRVGVRPVEFRDAFEARNLFYQACYANPKIEEVGFTEQKDFPIKRRDFTRLQVSLPPKEPPLEIPWNLGIVTLNVTSPNWDKEDDHRYWKGKDSEGHDRYFRIEDEQFWGLVKEERLNTHIIDTIKVQWAFHVEGARMKHARVLRVLEFNGDHLADPLDESALNALLGNFQYAFWDPRQPDLF